MGIAVGLLACRRNDCGALSNLGERFARERDHSKSGTPRDRTGTDRAAEEHPDRVPDALLGPDCGGRRSAQRKTLNPGSFRSQKATGFTRELEVNYSKSRMLRMAHVRLMSWAGNPKLVLSAPG